jgi:hypothetical protein
MLTIRSVPVRVDALRSSRSFEASSKVIWTGRASAFLLCCLVVVVWAATTEDAPTGGFFRDGRSIPW